MKSPGTENSYVIFGEAKIHDFPGSIGKEELGKF